MGALPPAALDFADARAACGASAGCSTYVETGFPASLVGQHFVRL
jgi:hypothetical protein